MHRLKTYVFSPLSGQLRQVVEEAEQREPRAPEHHLLQLLHAEHAEDENELVKYKVPEGVLHGLALGDAQFSEHGALDAFAQQH